MDEDLEKKFIEAFDVHADALYRHCFFRVFRKARAEELVQETFMKTWEYLRRGNQVDNLKAFLYKVATNLIIDDARKKKEESLDMLLEEDAFSEPAYEVKGEIENRMALKDIVAAMGELERGDKELLSMRYLEDIDPKDIADILGIRAGTVSVRLSRALKKLREHFNT